MTTPIETPEWLTRWGFTLAKEAPTSQPVEREPRDPYRDVEQVKQLLLAEGITPAMLLAHPHIKFTAEAKDFLEDSVKVPAYGDVG